MKFYQSKHTVKIRKKQPDLFGYCLLFLRGGMPLIAYILISMAINNLTLFNLNLKLPYQLLIISILIFVINTFII